MEAGELDGALVAKSVELIVCQGEEVDVVEEIGQHLGVDYDRRFDLRIDTLSQTFHFACKKLQQIFLIGCLCDDIADLVALEYTLCEGAEIEPDDDVGNPALRLQERF